MTLNETSLRAPDVPASPSHESGGAAAPTRAPDPAARPLGVPRRRLSRDTVRRRIVLLAMAGFLLAFGVTGSLGWWAVQESTERSLQDRLTLARAVVSHLDDVLRVRIEVLQGVGSGNGPELAREALQAAQLRGGFSRVFLLDSSGRLILAEPATTGQPEADPSSLPHIRSVLATGRQAVSTVDIQEGGGLGSRLSTVVPLRGADGLVGLAVGDLDLPNARLQQIIRSIDLPATARVEVVNSDGLVIAATDDSHLFRQSDHRHVLAALIEARRSTVGTCHGCHGSAPYPRREEEVMAVAPSGVANLAVVVSEAEREALAPVRRLEQGILLLGIPCLAVAGGVAGLVGRRLAGSIAGLARSASRIAEGDLDSPVSQGGPEEVRRVAGALDEMRDRQRSSIASVNQLNAELESRVHRRTEQLARSEAELLRRNVELSVLNTEIRRREADRGELLRKVIGAQEEERKRIARDLHDDATQTVSALILAVETAEATSGSPESARQLASARELGAQAIASLHKLMLDLRPSILDDLGLVAALRWYAESHLVPLGVELVFEAEGPVRRLAPEVEIAMFRIAQEAISNVARHSRAERAVVNLDFADDRLTIHVEDDGSGFSLDSVGRPTAGGRGLGLLGMRERAELIGGKLEVHSRPGLGTTVRVQVRLADGSSAAPANGRAGGGEYGQDPRSSG